jgi:hypothetical protein
MEPEVDGKPLLSLNDLEARLVFTRCKVSISIIGITMTILKYRHHKMWFEALIWYHTFDINNNNNNSFDFYQPFTLNTPDRHWIFAGDLSRVEGRSVRSYWALLFSDILLFTKVSRDRVLFVTDEPLPLSSIAQTQFSVKKKGKYFFIKLLNKICLFSLWHNKWIHLRM